MAIVVKKWWFFITLPPI